LTQWKRVLIGPPLSSDRAHEEKLTRPKALAIFASDALSSNAYATEEILLVLAAVGSGALSVPIAAAIIGLLALLVTSYRQTIAKYPQGGAYSVTSDTLGRVPSLVAGASLLVDYTLTVAVSVSAGIAAIISAAPGLLPFRVELCLVAVVVITLLNLRGVRESGNVFAVPPYIFILAILALIAVGLYQLAVFGRPARSSSRCSRPPRA
jgi:amino acid transporter